MNKKSPRLLAVECVTDVILNKQSLQQVLPIAKNLCQKKEDKALLQALCYGVLRYYPRLIWIIRHLLNTKIKPKDLGIFPLIAVGLYQLMDMRIAQHAAIKETVEITKIIKKPWWTGLVNAVLRSYQRTEADILSLIQAESMRTSHNTPDLECYYLHPIWFIKQIQKAWPETWEEILKQNNITPPLTLRINQQNINLATYHKQLTEHQIISCPVDENYLNSALNIENPIDVQLLPGYEQGFFSVQDGAAQLAARFLDLQPNQNVLDACAAPGVKTTHLFELEPSVRVTAIDVSPSRIETLKENCRRLNVNPRVIVANASQVSDWWDKVPFDRILLDAPCSATGVIRRHPDIKFLRNPEDIVKFSLQQYELLVSLWPLLKPGGILLYATCSILPAENSEVILSFLANHTDAQLMPLLLPFGISLPIGHQILPGQKNLDGFYYCRIGKNIA